MFHMCFTYVTYMFHMCFNMFHMRLTCVTTYAFNDDIMILCMRPSPSALYRNLAHKALGFR